MLLVKMMMLMATGFWYGPDAAKVRVAVDDGVCKIGRAVVQPMCGDDHAARVVVRVQTDDEDKPGKCDGKRCAVVCKRKQCDESGKTDSKKIVCKKVTVTKKGDGPPSVVCQPGEAMGWCRIEDLPGCGDQDGSQKIVRMKVICSDEDGKSSCSPSCCKKSGRADCCEKEGCKKIIRMKVRGCEGDGKSTVGCGDFKLGGAIELDDDILDLSDLPPPGMKDGPNRIWITKRGDKPGCDAGDGPFFVKVGACGDAEDDDPPGEARAYVTAVTNAGSDDVAPGGPWLGIQFGPVPKALTAHLSIDKDAGQMILNIIEDSPADEAGLQLYDVIVRMDGEDAPADIEKFMTAVRKFEPGEKHEFALIRGGREAKVSLTVGKRPEKIGASKYESELEELAKADVLHHGGILRKDADGNWKFENLGDLKDMQKLWQHLPDENAVDHIFKWSGALPGSRCDFDIETKEGKLQIERCGEKTTVPRTTMEGDKRKVITKTYDNDEEFKKGDPEAYEMMKKHTCFEFKLGGKGGKCFVAPGGDVLKQFGEGSEFEVNLKEMMKNAEEMRKEAGKAGAEAKKAAAQAARAYSESLGGYFAAGKARTSFEVSANGEIKVTTRKGDEELTQTYADADALKKARPDLYEKFRKLQGEGEGRKTKMRIQTDD